MRALAVGVVLVVAGCFPELPSVESGGFRCAVDDDCAAGYACAAGVCSDGTTPPRDAGVERDAGTRDAGTARDAGTDPVDAGTDPVDAGSDPVDATTDPDAGTAPDASDGPVTWQALPMTRPTRLVVDGDDLYWTDANPSGSVMRRRIAAGSSPQPIAVNQSYPDRLVVSDTHVFWTALEQTSGPRPGHIRYRDKALTAATFDVTSSTQRSPDGLAVADGIVFWTEDSPLYIRAHSVGTAVDNYWERQFSGGSSYVQTMVADATYVYWFDSSANLFRHPHALPAIAPEPMLMTNQEEPKSAVLENRFIYFGDSSNGLQTTGWLRRVSLETFAVETLAANAHPGDDEHGVFELAVDTTHVYYSTESASGRHGRVYRVPITGGTPELLYAPSDPANTSIRGVERHGRNVYWAEWTWNGSRVDGRIASQAID